MFWNKKVSKADTHDTRIDEYIALYDMYSKQGCRDGEVITKLVNLAYDLTYEMPREAIYIFCDKYNFHFKRADGTVFSSEDVLERKANITDANLIETEKWCML